MADASCHFSVGQRVMAMYATNARFYPAKVVVVSEGANGEDGRTYTVDWADGDANHREVSEAYIRAA